jgi:hypothetical protein
MPARSKAGGYGRSYPGIAGSNPTGIVGTCLLRVLCVVRYRSLCRADHSFRGVLPGVVCLSIIDKPKYRVGPGSLEAVAPWKK